MNTQELATITLKVTWYETNLFDHTDIAKENIHVPDASADDLELAVKSYQEKELNKAQIDVQILGIGRNVTLV